MHQTQLTASTNMPHTHRGDVQDLLCSNGSFMHLKLGTFLDTSILIGTLEKAKKVKHVIAHSSRQGQCRGAKIHNVHQAVYLP